MRYSTWKQGVLFFSSLFIGLAAYADEHDFSCIKTAQAFQTALDQSSDGGIYSGYDVNIYLASGTFKTGAATGNQPFHYSSTVATGSLSIRGGLSADCMWTSDPTLTQLDGNHATQVLNLYSKNGVIGITELTVQNGSATEYGGGANINFGMPGSATQEVFVQDVIFHNNATTSDDGAFVIQTHNTGYGLHFWSSISYANSAVGNYGGGSLLANNGSIDIAHAIVFDNTSNTSGGTGGLICNALGGGICYVTTSVFWSNDRYGIYFGNGADNVMKQSDFGTRNGPVTTDTDNISSNPKFLDPDNGNFYLGNGSPLIGAANDHEGLVEDPHGHVYARPITDIGTFAETIFNGDFEQ